MFFKLTILLLMFFISSCQTTYQKQGFSGGYSDQLTGQNTATVYYKSNTFTSMSDTRRFAMRRASELTLSKGYDYFLIENDNQYLKKETYSGSVQCNTIGFSTTCNNVGGGSFTKPRVQLNIRMFSGTVPNKTGYYDAKYFTK